MAKEGLMDKKIDSLIPLALEAAGKCLATPSNAIPSEYSGYIASFGASVIQAGLKPAVAFNERKADSAEDKRPLMKAILYILKKQNQEGVETNETDDRLLDYILAHQDSEKQIKRRIMDATTALKLAIRTFRLVKKGEV